MNTSQELVTPDVLLALQLRSGNDRLFPRLNKFACDGVNEGFIPSIPLFLSSKIVNIKIRFAAGSPTVMVASTIARLSILCPNLECVLVTLSDLPRDPVIIEAVSEMLLACNRDVLRLFVVNSPLTEEARRVLYQLPNLQQLWTVIQGPTSLSPMTLPNLVIINLEYDHGHEWLRGFDGATLGRLKYANFHAKSVAAPLTNFLEEFKRVALTTSAPSTLLRFAFRTIRLRNPDYSSLLVFKQLTELVVEFSCHNDCSSTVDDNIIIDLAEAMPKLRILQLGRPPCRVSTGITFKGLVTLAHRCPQLTRLCVHLQVLGFSEPASTEPPPPPKHAAIIPRMSCALTNLQVGEAPIVQRSVMAISFTLLQLFPQLLNLEYANPQWRRVVETIELFKRIDGHVLHASKPDLPRL